MARLYETIEPTAEVAIEVTVRLGEHELQPDVLIRGAAAHRPLAAMTAWRGRRNS